MTRIETQLTSGLHTPAFKGVKAHLSELGSCLGLRVEYSQPTMDAKFCNQCATPLAIEEYYHRAESPYLSTLSDVLSFALYSDHRHTRGSDRQRACYI